MKIATSYAIEIRHINKLFRQMNKIYNDAITYCITVFEKEWNYLSTLNELDKKNQAEHLIHNTKNNKAKYDFDSKFYKIPTYLRRAITSTALGYLSSYHSNYNNWVESGKQGKHPTLQNHLHEMPVDILCPLLHWVGCFFLKLKGFFIFSECQFLITYMLASIIS